MLKLHRNDPDPMHTTEESGAHARPSGFRATFDGMSLWDVIQMACLAGTQRAVRVRATEGEGHLFFNGGIVVHAVTGGVSGDDAVLEMLRWEGGDLVPCQIEWPKAQTVHTPWETLLLQAALRKDEAQGVPQDAHSEPPKRAYELVMLDPTATAPAPTAEDEAVPPALQDGSQDAAPQHAAAQATVALDADGEVIDVGGDAELAGRVARARRMANRLGDLMALGRFEAMEVSNGGTSIFAHPQSVGITAAHETDDNDARAALRARLGL